LFDDIIKDTTPETDPKGRLKSLMINQVAGKRDLGQCEVSRLLLSEPLYHSTFTYISQNLDLDNREINTTGNDNELASKKNIIDHYANRSIYSGMEQNINLITFLQKYKLTKNEIVSRNIDEKLVVTTFPKYRYNKNDKEKYKKYCYYAIIKYKPWTKDDYETIKNKDTAVQRWEQFLENATPEILSTIA
jgi:hypothetical protein